MNEDVQKKVQDLLAEARAKLAEVQLLVDEHMIGGSWPEDHISFLGCRFVPSVGLMSSEDTIEIESEWNHSRCVIEARRAWMGSTAEC